MPGLQKPLKITTPLPLPSTPNSLPILGFGTWDSPTSKTTTSVLTALSAGYRHIDTAQGYSNEAEVGQAIRHSNLPRSSIFITTKIWEPRGSVEANYQACLKSVEALDPGPGPDPGDGNDGKERGYVDLFLVHNVLPSRKDREEVWRALERLQSEGRVKGLGVSNWGIKTLEEGREYMSVWPPVNDQIELHPWCQQSDLTLYLEKHSIGITAYCPLVRNREKGNPTVVDIADKYQKSEAQVLLRYCLEKGWAPLPKSDTPSRIRENAEIFDFELTREEVGELDGVRREGRDEPCVMVAEN